MAEKKKRATKAAPRRPGKSGAAAPGGSAPRRVVAIVGSEGSLGKGLAARLEALPSVRRIVGVDLRRPESVAPKARFHRLDLTRPSADQELADILTVEEVDTLVHLAFFGAPIPNASYAHELEVIGTLHVLTAAAASQVTRLVARSTTAVYGAHPKNPSLLREEHPARGTARSRFINDKLEAERQVLAFAAEHPDCAVAVLRFAPILSPSVQNIFQRYLTRGLAPTLAGHDPLMQALHVEDAVEALVLAVRGDARGVFNVADPGVLPISAALRLCGTLPVPLPHPVAAATLRGLRNVGLGAAFPAAMLDYLRYPFVTDASRIESELGFVPRHTTREAVLSIAGRERAA